jgi:hypothetical protein
MLVLDIYFPLYHASQMETLRKYWFLLFLAATLIACVVALLEPSVEPTVRKWVIGGFAVAFIYGIYDRLDRVERKLDAILKKLSEG